MEEGKRKLASWLDAFVDYTESINSPLIFRKWAGILCLAGALERKIWVMSKPPEGLYPNMYVCLVGPPGVGKTDIIRPVKSLWKAIKTVHIARSSLSRASLIDSLKDAHRSEVVNRASKVIQFHSLQIASNELTVLLPKYDPDILGTLTELYEGDSYGEKKRTSEIDHEIEHPNINIIAGTTPSYLRDLMPDGFWDQGLASRFIFVYSGENNPAELFHENGISTSTKTHLIEDLSTINKLYGEVKFTAEAVKEINCWHIAKGPPRPDHPRLQHYNIRRTAHVLKLCMILSASESNNLVVTIEHFRTARAMLLEMENYIPDIFKAMASGGDRKIIDETWHFVYKMYARENRPVIESRVINFVSEHAPSHAVERLIQVMVRAKILQEAYPDKASGKCYVPLARLKE